jgi:hypothetical protein
VIDKPTPNPTPSSSGPASTADPAAPMKGIETMLEGLAESSLVGREGRSIKGEKGDKGDKGDQGDPGPSAYEVARANGFAGSQAAWLDSLKGSEGDPGKDGRDGRDGIDSPRPKAWRFEIVRDQDGQLAEVLATAVS